MTFFLGPLVLFSLYVNILAMPSYMVLPRKLEFCRCKSSTSRCLASVKGINSCCPFSFQMLSKSIEQLKQPGSHLEEAEEELHGDPSMQEEQAPASGASVRAESSSADVDDRIGQQVGAVKVKEEPLDSDEDVQTQQMESGEQAAFMQQVIGKDLAPGFVIKVII